MYLFVGVLKKVGHIPEAPSSALADRAGIQKQDGRQYRRASSSQMIISSRAFQFKHPVAVQMSFL